MKQQAFMYEAARTQYGSNNVQCPTKLKLQWLLLDSNCRPPLKRFTHDG
jgi:hypothetical protein